MPRLWIGLAEGERGAWGWGKIGRSVKCLLLVRWGTCGWLSASSFLLCGLWASWESWPIWRCCFTRLTDCRKESSHFRRKLGLLPAAFGKVRPCLTLPSASSLGSCSLQQSGPRGGEAPVGPAHETPQGGRKGTLIVPRYSFASDLCPLDWGLLPESLTLLFLWRGAPGWFFMQGSFRSVLIEFFEFHLHIICLWFYGMRVAPSLDPPQCKFLSLSSPSPFFLY